jgi:hypothetical protein
MHHARRRNFTFIPLLMLEKWVPKQEGEGLPVVGRQPLAAEREELLQKEILEHR